MAQATRVSIITVVAASVLGVGLFLAGAQLQGPRPAQAAEPPQHAPMDHGDKTHHHHLHKGDHRGAEHAPAGLGDHHHHHHTHPHAPDPHHHHPH